ncbi:MAG: glutathione S-transferase family protein [Pseudomonadota bacterium]
MAGKPVLYHCPQTRGGTTHWMNEELGDVCEVRIIDFKKGEQQQTEFLKINPMGKIPTLVHDGVVVTEAAAICAYLADAFFEKGLAPAQNDPKRGAYFRWMFFAPSCIEPAMMDIFLKRKNENPQSVGWANAERVIETAKSALNDGDYILGDQFSAADVVFGSTLNFAMMFGAIEKQEPFTSYVDRLMSRPAVIRGNEKNAAWMKELGWE